MKRLALILLICLFATPLFAAEGMVVSDRQDFRTMKTITFTCTTATNGAFSQQISTAAYQFIGGWMVGLIRVTNATTQTDVTDDSDLKFRLTSGGTFDLLYGAGTDRVDKDTVNEFRPNGPTGSAFTTFMVDQFYIELANNSANTAIFDVKLILLPQ